MGRELSSVLASALLAVILIVAGSWALNNTAVGLNIKCRVFNDLGACFIVALTEPVVPNSGGNTYVPPPTETPEERAAREAAEEQARLDAAVQDASSALGRAIDDLLGNADELMGGADDMTSAVAGVGSSADGMQSAYTALKDQTRVRPMDDFAQNDVCFALNDVGFARSDVDFAVNGFEFAKDPYTTTLESRTGYIAAVQPAVARLNAAVNANPRGVSPQQTAFDADAALSSASTKAKAAAIKAGEAKAQVTALVKSADAWMKKARKLAASVASC